MCACNHLTDFTSFVKGSYQTILGSNYNALSALQNSSWSSLKKNVGLRLCCILIGCLTILVICDRMTESKLTSE